MGELGFNKFFGAMLATVLFIFGLNELATGVFGGGGHHGDHEYESQNEWAEANFHGYRVDIAEAASGATEVEEDIFDLGLALASADVAAGETAMRQCAQCHTWNEGGANGTGPNLYGIMGQDIAGVDGFAYSGALSGIDGAWTYEAMNEWLANPGSYARGNKMAFAGLRSPRKDAERTNIIAYLASVSPNAPAFPEPLAVETADAADTIVETNVTELETGGDLVIGEEVTDGVIEGAETIPVPVDEAAEQITEGLQDTVDNAIETVTDVVEDATSED